MSGGCETKGQPVASDMSIFGILKQNSHDAPLQTSLRLTEKGPLTCCVVLSSISGHLKTI